MHQLGHMSNENTDKPDRQRQTISFFFLTDLSSGSLDFGPNEASPVAASTRTSAQSCRFPTIVASVTLYQTRSSRIIIIIAFILLFEKVRVSMT